MGNAGVNQETLAVEIARQLIKSWDAHLAGRTDCCKVVIHVLNHQQAEIEWPQPARDKIKLNRPR